MQDACVIVVSDGDEGRLGAALASVLEHAGWLELDAVVVDTGDGRVASHVEERFIDVRTIRCPGRGLNHACNRALETVSARYVLFLNPDLEVCEGSLSTLVAALDSRPNVALAGARHLSVEGDLLPSMKRFPSARHVLAEAFGIDRLPAVKRVLGEYELDKRKYARETACDWTTGFMLVRRVAMEKDGWFDERFPRFAGEADLCLRLKRAGWQVVYSPALTVRRRHVSRWENARLEVQAAQARMQYARKHFPRAAADYRWAMALRYALRLALYTASGRYGRGRRQAARAALATVLKGGGPGGELPAL
jgi:hypothetical protein